MSPKEAQRAARIELGGIDTAAPSTRNQQSSTMVLRDTAVSISAAKRRMLSPRLADVFGVAPTTVTGAPFK
jgi:hypothetical protein